MPSPRRRTFVTLALTLVALGATADCLLLLAWGSRAPAWSHWLCSPSALHNSAQHHQPIGGLAATLLTTLKTLLPHWPHILPVLLALATLVYLRRANAHYHAHEGQVRARP
jgi:hypothetical protein